MKIGVISDTHRMNRFIDKTIPYLKECDLIIHAGDNFIDSKYIHKMTGVSMMAVKNIFVCHGDKYGVKYGLEQLHEKAKNICADIVIFGHTHTPVIKEKNNILYINPGSISLPRGVNYRSFVILEISSDNVSIDEIRL